MAFVQKHEDLAMVLVIAVVCVVMTVGLLAFFEWNDQQWFKTLDKLTCEEIWEYMIEQGGDWDTLDYYGDRC